MFTDSTKSDRGLVLVRHFPKKNKVCFFSAQHGKVIASAQPKVLDFLWPGSVFECKIDQPREGLFRLEQVTREKIPIGLCHKRLTWLNKLSKAASLILPSGDQCENTFQILQKIFLFDWAWLEGKALTIFQNSSFVSLLAASGFVHGPSIEAFCYIFDLIVSSRVDPKQLSNIQSSTNAFDLCNLDMSLIEEQIKNGFDPHLHTSLFGLIAKDC